MSTPKIITRENLEERIPYCYGIIQRLADDLNVTRSAVSKFLNLPENANLKEIVQAEKSRLRDYAQMTVTKRLLAGDIETAKWFLTTFTPNGNAVKPYKPKKAKDKDYILLNIDRESSSYRELCFGTLDCADGISSKTGKPTPYKILPEIYWPDPDPETIDNQRREEPKSGREIYEEFKKKYKRK